MITVASFPLAGLDSLCGWVGWGGWVGGLGGWWVGGWVGGLGLIIMSNHNLSWVKLMLGWVVTLKVYLI